MWRLCSATSAQARPPCLPHIRHVRVQAIVTINSRCLQQPRQRVHMTRPTIGRLLSSVRHFASISGGLPRPPPPPPPDSAYSSSGANADSSFSSASLQPVAPPLPSRLVSPLTGLEMEGTWTSVSSSNLGPQGRVMIYCSEVAGLVGMNRYRQMYESFENVWARTDPEMYKHRIAQVEMEIGRRLLTDKQQAELVVSQHSSLSSLLQRILADVASLSNEDLALHKTSLKVAAKALAPSLITTQQAELVADYLVGELSKSYGIVNEDRAVKAYEEVVGQSVTDNNRLFYGMEIGVCTVEQGQLEKDEAAASNAALASTTVTAAAATVASNSSSAASSAASSSAASSSPSIPVCSLNDPSPIQLTRAIWIGGRVDGFIDRAGRPLLEIKNRTNKFMNPLPLYDLCQMECYFQICDRETGELVERLRRKVSSQEAAETMQKVKRFDVRTTTTRTETPLVAEQSQSEPLVQQPASEVNEKEIVDEEFLQQDAGLVASFEPLPAPESDPTEDHLPSSVGVADDFDSDFLADPAPLVLAEEVEEDTSFLTDPTLLSSRASSASAAAASTAAMVAPVEHDPDASPLPPPLLSHASSPVFEIIGTQQLADPAAASIAAAARKKKKAVSKKNDKSGAADESADEVSDEVIVAPGALSAPQLTYILVREYPMPSRPIDEEEDDLIGDEDEEGRVRAKQLDQAFLRESLRDEPQSAEERDGVALDEDSPSSPLMPSDSDAAEDHHHPEPTTTPTLYIDQLKRSPLRRDDRMWNEQIRPQLLVFARFLTRFLASPSLQRSYLLCDTPEAKHAILAEIMPVQIAQKFKYDYTAKWNKSKKGGSDAATAWRQSEMDTRKQAALTDVYHASNNSNSDTRNDTEAAATTAKPKRKRNSKPADAPAQ